MALLFPNGCCSKGSALLDHKNCKENATSKAEALSWRRYWKACVGAIFRGLGGRFRLPRIMAGLPGIFFVKKEFSPLIRKKES